MTQSTPLTIPEERPSAKASAPKPAAGHSLSSYPLCPKDGFPMVDINGQLKCSVEVIDRCVGGRMVVDVIQRKKIIYYVFDNGHQLPLLCGCCGEGLGVANLDEERQDVRGRRLEAMSLATKVFEEDGREQDELVLEFSKSGLLSRPLDIPVAFEVAAQLRHPPNDPQKKRKSPSKRPTSKKKKRARKQTQSRKKKGRKKNR